MKNTLLRYFIISVCFIVSLSFISLLHDYFFTDEDDAKKLIKNELVRHCRYYKIEYGDFSGPYLKRKGSIYYIFYWNNEMGQVVAEGVVYIFPLYPDVQVF